jgi:hypothetical protein
MLADSCRLVKPREGSGAKVSGLPVWGAMVSGVTPFSLSQGVLVGATGISQHIIHPAMCEGTAVFFTSASM